MKIATGTPLTFGTLSTGMWCDICLLPSRARTPVYALLADGPIEIGYLNHGCEHEE